MRAIPHQSSCALYPLIALACSFACGILVAQFVVPRPLIVCLSCGLFLYAFAFVCFARRKERAALYVLALAFFFAGMTMALVEEKNDSLAGSIRQLYEDGSLVSGEPTEVTGVLESAPEAAPDEFYLTLRVEALRWKGQERKASGVVQLVAPVRDEAQRVAYEQLELRYGARLRVMTNLRREERFRNPGVASAIEALERRGFDAVGTIKSPLLIERLDDERVFLPLALLYEWRQRLLGEIDRNFSAETAGVLGAALLGNRNTISRATAERFRVGGTFHVLVISGLHISFLGVLAFGLMRRVTKRRGWQFASTVIFLWSYALAVGAGASVVRAALMFTLVALAPVLHRRIETFNSLGGAVLTLLVWRPADLFDPSFQLTFLSVLSIAALAWPVIGKLQIVGAWRLSRETPYPPVCPRFWRVLGETLFWSERNWQREMERANFRCKLFKTTLAVRLERWHVQRVLRYAFGAVVVSASVQIGMLPLLILYFHRLSFASFVLNIAVGLLMAAESLIALTALLVAQVNGFLAVPLFFLAEQLNWLMTHSVDPLASAHVASVRLPEYTGWLSAVYGIYYVPLGLLIFALLRWNPLRRDVPNSVAKGRRRARFTMPLVAAAFIAMLVLIVAHPLSAHSADGKLRIDFLDVGQGDAALVTMPNGTTLLIDAGGRPRIGASARSFDEDTDEPFERDRRSIGESVVSEYLWWRGLDHVDYILPTHADADHINGFNDVARNFKVRAALVARTPVANSEYAHFASSMREYGVPVQIIGRGDVLRFGNATAEVLWPQPTMNADAASGNDDSVVLRVRFGERVFLLTGDMEKEAESALVAAKDDVHCDLIKIAHHGSKTSSTQEFVTAVHPSLAIVSVGLTSPFGHPDGNVMERWRESGAQVLTTGKSGTITVSTNGHDLNIETFVKK